MLITNSTTGISHYMGNKSRYAIKRSSSFRMASSVLRRQALWEVCKTNRSHAFWMKKSFILEEALLHEVATWMHHTLASFLSLKWLASSLTCRDFHNNSVSVMYMIELATAESNTQFIPDLIVPACCQQQCVSWQAILAFR